MGKRARRLVALALIAATVVVLQAAPAVARPGGSIRLVGATSPVVTGTRITLAGRFRYGGNRVYVIQRAEPGTHHWKIVKVTKARTTKRGYYRATVRARWDFRYRALLLKTSTQPRLVSKAIRVDTKGWLQISANGGHTCGIWYDQTLWCWGYNDYGQLGNPTNNGSSSGTWVDNTTPNPVPTQVVDSTQNPGAPQTWKSVSVGTLYTCGIRTDQTLWCWGLGIAGQLGTGSADENQVPLPTPLLVDDSAVNTTAPQTWTAVTAAGGLGHTCGIRTDQSLWCWGANVYGQLATTASSTLDYSTPLLVDDSAVNTTAPQTWQSLAGGFADECGIRSNQTLWCWGDNQSGELGNPANSGTTNPNSTPLAVTDSSGYASAPQTWQMVSSESMGVFACGIRTDQSLWCWGIGTAGQLGPSSTSDVNDTPLPVSDRYPDQSWQSVSAGLAHTCGIRTDHTLWCWGNNDYGQLANTTNTGYKNTTPNPIPIKVTTPAVYQTWLAVDAGMGHTCGIRSDKALWCWGDNKYGQLGRTTTSMGTDNPNPKPLRVPNPTN